MTTPIHLQVGDLHLEAQMNDSPTAQEIARVLPLEGKVHRWGDELYFEIPVELPEAEDARQDMEVGELGYWPSGRAFCIFFGPTPVSSDDTPRAYTKVNPFGKVRGDLTPLKAVIEGTPIKVTGAGQASPSEA